MNNNDIFNLIRNAVNMHENRDCLERFKSLCRQFVTELEQTEEKGNISNADFLKCLIGDIREQVLEPLEDLSNIPLNNVKYLKITRENIEKLKQLDNKLQARPRIRVNINDAALAQKRVEVLMGDKVEPRKEWIDENVEFTLEDDYRG